MTSPRLWFPMDVLFKEQDVVKDLQTSYGTAGPWLFVWLLSEAYHRHFLKERPSGIVNMGYARLTRDAGVEDRPFETADEVTRGTMRNLQGAGIIEFVEGDLESATFRVRFSKWEDWLPDHFADPTSAERQARHRAKKAARSNPEGTDSESNGPVTECHAKRERETKSLTPPVREEVAKLSNLLATLIRTRDPKARVAPSSKPWTDAVRLLIDKDGRSVADIEHVIRWCQKDKFWCVNILSTPKLREKFDQLYAKAGKPKGNADDFFSRNGM